MAYNSLTDAQKESIIFKRTEPRYSGEYDDFFEDGTFICRQCNSPLFSSKAKFDARCGWPAFDAEFPHSIKIIPGENSAYFGDEVLCTHCGGHLGHVFHGEGFTDTDTRHCVNSLAIQFVPKVEKLPEILDE